ncbi:cyclin [Legionella lytica]|uniref:Cyclin n=1 Tax=Legionella lytica TaxID=96232 RepID=A0ABW8DB82_9GAMM
MKTGNTNPKPKTGAKLEELTNVVIFFINTKIQNSTEQKIINPGSAFNGNKIPSISVPDYLRRHIEHLPLKEVDIIGMFVLLERYLKTTTTKLTLTNVHRLITSCIYVSHKTLNDDCYSLSTYAQIGGVSSAELRNLELCLLFSIDFDIGVTPAIYTSYKQMFINYMQSTKAQASTKPTSDTIHHSSTKPEERTVTKEKALVSEAKKTTGESVFAARHRFMPPSSQSQTSLEINDSLPLKNNFNA